MEETKYFKMTLLRKEIIGKLLIVKCDHYLLTKGKKYEVIDYNDDDELTNSVCIVNDLGETRWFPLDLFDFTLFVEAERQSEIAKFEAYPYDTTAGNVEDEIDHAKRNIYKRGFKNGFIKASQKDIIIPNFKNNFIKTAELKDLEMQVSKGEISYSRMIELLNEKAETWHQFKKNELINSENKNTPKVFDIIKNVIWSK